VPADPYSLPGRVALRLIRAALVDHLGRLGKRSQASEESVTRNRRWLAEIEAAMADQVRGLAPVPADVTALLCGALYGDLDAISDAARMEAKRLRGESGVTILAGGGGPLRRQAAAYRSQRTCSVTIPARGGEPLRLGHQGPHAPTRATTVIVAIRSTR
jgi:hypothetical protein